MRHELTPDIVEQLQRKYDESLARVREAYATPWWQYFQVLHFERPNIRSGTARPIVCLAVAAWLVACLSIGGIVRLVDAVRFPFGKPASAEAARSGFGAPR